MLVGTKNRRGGSRHGRRERRVARQRRACLRPRAVGLPRPVRAARPAAHSLQRAACLPGVLATLSITAARDAHGSLLIFCGIIALIAAAGLFFAGIVWFSLDITPRVRELADDYLLSSRRHAELQILGNTVSVIRRNERTLQRADSLFGFAVLLLFLGTLLIGARVALLLL